jgi:hypothetical protein
MVSIFPQSSCCRIIIIVLLLGLSGCSSKPDEQPSSYNWQQILSRDEGDPAARIPIYQAKVPITWQRKDPLATESNENSMKSICEFYIGLNEDLIRLTVHSFPSQSLKDRIPPSAQIQRWKQQFEKLSASDFSITQESKGGYTGLFFQANGLIDGQKRTVLGWSMQMAPEQFLNLQEPTYHDRHARADYTIKVVGASSNIQRHFKDLLLFAASFELIEEIPQR